jgi:hypothetical protein
MIRNKETKHRRIEKMKKRQYQLPIDINDKQLTPPNFDKKECYQNNLMDSIM